MNRHSEQLVSVVFRLPRAKLERLRKLAKSTRINRSEFLREAIGDLIKKHAAAFETCGRCFEVGDLDASGYCPGCAAHRAARQLAWERSQLTCGCGRSYTWAEYLALPAPVRGSQQPTFDDDDREIFLELRDCACQNTMARLVGPCPDGWAR